MNNAHCSVTLYTKDVKQEHICILKIMHVSALKQRRNWFRRLFPLTFLCQGLHLKLRIVLAYNIHSLNSWNHLQLKFYQEQFRGSPQKYQDKVQRNDLHNALYSAITLDHRDNNYTKCPLRGIFMGCLFPCPIYSTIIPLSTIRHLPLSGVN